MCVCVRERDSVTRDKKEEATICERLCGYSSKEDEAVVQIGVV